MKTNPDKHWFLYSINIDSKIFLIHLRLENSHLITKFACITAGRKLSTDEPVSK